MRFITAVGNYDYIFDWVFRQNGTITVALGASGIEQVKAVKSRSVTDDPDGRDMAYGRLVAPHTMAVHHDHFLNFRLDLDVDGPQNSMLIEALIPMELSQESPRRSIWTIQPQTPATEQEAKLHIMMDKPALWRVINPNVTGTARLPYQLRTRSQTRCSVAAEPRRLSAAACWLHRLSPLGHPL